MSHSSELQKKLAENHKKVLSYFNLLESESIESETIFQALSQRIETPNPESFAIQLRKFFIRCIACSTSTDAPNYSANRPMFVLVSKDERINEIPRWLCPPQLMNAFSAGLMLDGNAGINTELATKFLIHLNMTNLSAWELSHSIPRLNDILCTVGKPAPGKHTTILTRIANFIGTSTDLSLLEKNAQPNNWLCVEVKGIKNEFWKPGNHNYLDVKSAWALAKKLHDHGEDGKISLADQCATSTGIDLNHSY